MTAAETGIRIELKNVLLLTDFSEPSESALRFAATIARQYGAELHALHVLVPRPLLYTSPEAMAGIAAMEEAAACEMQRVDSQLAGVSHETTTMRAPDVWTAVEQAVAASNADLLVLGTHGRTGLQKLMLGSVAEEVFRKATVPVLTIGPHVRGGAHGGGRFHRVLYATDFSAEAKAAAPYALSLAQEAQAQLVLLHVMTTSGENGARGAAASSIADAMHKLLELAPEEAKLWCRPEPVVQYGQVAERILEEARGRKADLVVLGVRAPEGPVALATHTPRSVAYRVVANAPCPVLTVRA